jgi:hypothetical protein
MGWRVAARGFPCVLLSFCQRAFRPARDACRPKSELGRGRPVFQGTGTYGHERPFDGRDQFRGERRSMNGDIHSSTR